MKIQLRKYAAGDKFWYSNINDYDPTKYTGEWDYEKGLIAGDTNTRRMPAWASRVAGLDPGRYTPTDLSPEYGTMGVGQNHYNYALSVEGLNWYKYNTDSMFDANNNLTDFGKWWILKTDDLLPVGHNARIFNSDGSIKNSITVKLNDAQGRTPVVKTFNLRNPQELKDYILHTRQDLTIGGRHNVAVLKGKRYFYVDNEGKYHWVSPEEAVKYNISEKPVEEGWDEDPNKRIYWLDYELTGLKDPNNPNPIEEEKRGQVPAKHGKYGFDWDKFRSGLQKTLGNPNIYALGRLIGNLHNNEKVYGEALKAINPDLRQSYHTHRQVVGDEATKQAYYRRAAQGQTRAGRPFTSDADRLVAYMNEAKRIGDELRAQGDLADNQEIRRTSDESNQHQWANIQRDTEVANVNRASINLANALKHNLLALKHSAQWSSIDNFLLGIEYRKRQQLAENLAIDDLIFMLLLEDDLANDPDILKAKQSLLTVLDKHSKKDSYGNVTYDYDNKDVKEAISNFKGVKNASTIKALRKKLEYLNSRSLINFSKSGTKITYKRKKKDDLLYKTARDTVEHFRKMSKISSDAYNRKTPKIEKLADHPKGSSRKAWVFQQGGVAPFTVYKPVAVGGETSTTTQTASSSSKSKGEKDETLDMIKELFKLVAGKGLPSDVNSLYASMLNFLSKAQVFGEEISTSDIASMYLSNMLQLNRILYLKANYDKAQETAIANDAINEFAVDFAGRLVCLDQDNGELKYAKSIAEAQEKGINPLTNGQLLQLRATLPSLAFRQDLDTIVANGIGMSKIAAFLKAQLPKLGSSEQTIEGYTKKGSNDIINGLRLLQEAPEGDYEYSHYTKELKELANAAINYLKGILPLNMRRIIETRAELGGLSANQLIGSLVSSGIDTNLKIELKAVTGKAAKDATKGSSGGKGTDTPASVQFLLGNGYSEVVEFNIGNSQSVKALGRFGILLDKEKNNLGQGSNLLDVSKSLFGPILDLNKATFGGTRLNSNGYSHVILNNSDCIGVDLPVKKDLSGNYVPDFLQLATIEKAEERIHNEGITNPLQINKIYRELGLPDKFDSNGNIILLNYRRFAGILVILDSKALKGGIPVNINEISEATDEERELFIEEMKKNGNKDYDLSDGILWSSWGRDKLYKGTIFAPVREDIVAGYTSGGLPLDTDLPNDANAVTMKQYAPKAQQYLKTPPLSSLK